MRVLVIGCCLAVLLAACVDGMTTGPLATPASPVTGRIQLADQLLRIDSLDVDSIEVIKGGAASALYGSYTCTAVINVVTRTARPKNRSPTQGPAWPQR